MSEVSNGDVSTAEADSSEFSEVTESTDTIEMDEELSHDLDDIYNKHLNSISEYEHTDFFEEEINNTNSMNDLDEDLLEAELDNKYNEYVEDSKKLSDFEKDNAEADIETIKCRNEELAGKEHPETEVLFEKRQVEVDGKQYEVVVPRFESEYDTQLPEDKLKTTDREQFKECNAQLKEEIANNKELRDRFDDEQLEQIENGDTPDGYTWHHDAEVGKMQLVDTEIHQRTGHTGGRSIWGGGTDNR